MEERVYKVMGGTGAANIAVGVIIMVTGIVTGTLLLVSGAKLFNARNKILF